MCNKAIDYYKILNKLRKKLIQQEIQITLKSLNKVDIDTEAKHLVAGILAREYTKRPSVANSIIEEYTKYDHKKVKDFSVLVRELQKLSNDTFNRIFELILNILKSRENGVRTSNLLMVTIQNGDLSTISEDIIAEIDYTGRVYNQLSLLMPNFMINCDLCYNDKSIENYKLGYTCCNTCKDKHKEAKKAVFKVKVSRNMAIESANSIKKDI